MNRRTFVSSLLASCAAAPGGRAAEAKPNIVVILADDLGYGDVGCFNPAAKTETPRIDGMAKEGIRFTDAHSPSAVCTPTRYGLLTGRYCWRTTLKSGVLNGYSPSLIEPGRETIASLLKKNGYRTGGFGKWHLGLGTAQKTDYFQELRPSPNDQGFDEYFGIPASLDMPPYLFFENRRAVETPTSTTADNGEVLRGPFWRGGPIAPSFRMEDVLPKTTDRACRFIEQSKSGPFFAYVPMNGPHTPWVPSAAWKGKAKAAGLYGDFVGEVDASVGRILDQLERSGVARNTLVIVTSDNGAPWAEQDAQAAGGHRANAKWRGQKADIQEAGHRVPFVLRWPSQVPNGRLCEDTVCLTDVFATAASAASVPLRPGMAEDSFSMLAAAMGERRRPPVRESIVHHSANGMFSIRKGEWKLVLGRGSGGFTQPVKVQAAAGEPPGELYNLARDPHEDDNLYAKETERVADLTELLAKIQKQGYSRNMGA